MRQDQSKVGLIRHTNVLRPAHREAHAETAAPSAAAAPVHNEAKAPLPTASPLRWSEPNPESRIMLASETGMLTAAGAPAPSSPQKLKVATQADREEVEECDDQGAMTVHGVAPATAAPPESREGKSQRPRAKKKKRRNPLDALEDYVSTNLEYEPVQRTGFPSQIRARAAQLAGIPIDSFKEEGFQVELIIDPRNVLACVRKRSALCKIGFVAQ